MSDKKIEEIMDRVKKSENPEALKDAIVMLALFRRLPQEARDKVIDLASVMVDQAAEEANSHE